MDIEQENRQHLRKMLDALINEDTDTAKSAFHDYVVNRSKVILEMDCCDPVGGDGKKDPKAAPGDKGVKATMAKTAKEDINASGEAKADPKAAPGDKSVKASIKDGKEIPKSGEAKADPKAAKGANEVKATLKKAADAKVTKLKK